LLLQAYIENHYDRKDASRDLARPIATVRTAVHRDPTDPNAWVLLGHFELSAGNEEAAADAYRRAILVFPWHSGALLRQAEIAQTLGDQRTRSAACLKLAALKLPSDACGP
jgi:cytochrome c-type biogenesis protein CcmH/NrfG